MEVVLKIVAILYLSVSREVIVDSVRYAILPDVSSDRLSLLEDMNVTL